MHARIIFHVYDFAALFLPKEEHGFSCLLFLSARFSVPLYIHCNAQNVEVKLPHYYCKKKDCGVVCGLFCTILVHRRSLLWRKSRRWRLAFVHRCFYIKNVSRSDTISNARRNFESADVIMKCLINDSANFLFGLYKQKSKVILIGCFVCMCCPDLLVMIYLELLFLIPFCYGQFLTKSS